MPSVKELEAFIAVLESGSFQGAARRLHATPPAVSKRVAELERELGIRLFDRSTRRCRITARGRALIPYAQRVLGDIGEIRRTVGQRSSLVGHVRLGVAETIAFTQLPELLKRFARDLRQLTVDVEVGVTPELIRRVRTRELDVACVVAPVIEQDLVSEPFWEMKMSWIAPGPRWTERPLTIDALAARTLVLQTGSRHIPVIEGWFRSRGVRPRHMITCNSLAAAVRMTAAGIGLSLVPIECARQELDDGTVTSVPVRVDLPANSFVTLYPVGQNEPALNAIIDVMRELSRDLLESQRARRRNNAAKQ